MFNNNNFKRYTFVVFVTDNSSSLFEKLYRFYVTILARDMQWRFLKSYWIS